MTQQKTLRTLHVLTTRYSFETVPAALEEGVRINRGTFRDTAVPAARISEYGLDTTAEQGPYFHIYDTLLTATAGASQ